MSADAGARVSTANGTHKTKHSRSNGKKNSILTSVITEPTMDELAGSNLTTTALDSPDLHGDDALTGPDTGSAQMIRELQKGIRSVNKKLNSMQKLNALIAQHPKVSLDDLVAQRLINPDQKAQALKRPGLEANLSQMEEQLAAIQKIEIEHSALIAAELQKLKVAHREELARVQEDTETKVTARVLAESRAQIKADADAAAAVRIAKDCRAITRRNILLFSRFLRTAAHQRQHADPNAAVTKGFEGLLLQAYGGDRASVKAVEKFISGSSDRVSSTDGSLLGVTYSEIKLLTLEHCERGSDGPSWESEILADNAAASDSSDTPLEFHGVSLSAQDIQSAIENGNGVGAESAENFVMVSQSMYAGDVDMGQGSTSSPGKAAFVPDTEGEHIPNPSIPVDGGSAPSPPDGRHDRWHSIRSGGNNGVPQRGGASRGDGRGRGAGWGGRGSRGGRGGFRIERGSARGTV